MGHLLPEEYALLAERAASQWGGVFEVRVSLDAPTDATSGPSRGQAEVESSPQIYVVLVPFTVLRTSHFHYLALQHAGEDALQQTHYLDGEAAPPFLHRRTRPVVLDGPSRSTAEQTLAFRRAQRALAAVEEPAAPLAADGPGPAEVTEEPCEPLEMTLHIGGHEITVIDHHWTSRAAREQRVRETVTWVRLRPYDHRSAGLADFPLSAEGVARLAATRSELLHALGSRVPAELSPATRLLACKIEGRAPALSDDDLFDSDGALAWDLRCFVRGDVLYGYVPPHGYPSADVQIKRWPTRYRWVSVREALAAHQR
jgi:hypothetical protein